MAKKYVMYDGRAKTGDTDDALIMNLEDNLDGVAETNQAFEDEDYVWYEYDEVGDQWTNEVMRMDLERHGLKPRKKKRQ